MFNDIQKHIEKKNKEEVEKKAEERLALAKAAAAEMYQLAKTKGLNVQETMFALKVVDNILQGHISSLTLESFPEAK